MGGWGLVCAEGGRGGAQKNTKTKTKVPKSVFSVQEQNLHVHKNSPDIAPPTSPSPPSSLERPPPPHPPFPTVPSEGPSSNSYSGALLSLSGSGGQFGNRIVRHIASTVSAPYHRAGEHINAGERETHALRFPFNLTGIEVER